MKILKNLRWFFILLQVIGCAAMGIHLFLYDGIKNPTWVLTFFAVVFAIGMVGLLITLLLLLILEERQKQ